MSFKTGDKVKIKTLGMKPGRVVGGQQTGTSRVTLYLVRYEMENAINRRSESSLYFEDELVKA